MYVKFACFRIGIADTFNERVLVIKVQRPLLAVFLRRLVQVTGRDEGVSLRELVVLCLSVGFRLS